MNDVAASVVTNTQTDTQTKYHNPAAHAPRVNELVILQSRQYYQSTTTSLVDVENAIYTTTMEVTHSC